MCQVSRLSAVLWACVSCVSHKDGHTSSVSVCFRRARAACALCTVFMDICARAFYQKCDASGAELFLKRLRSASPPHFSTTASKPRKDTTRLTSMKIQRSTPSVAGAAGRVKAAQKGRGGRHMCGRRKAPPRVMTDRSPPGPQGGSRVISDG